MRTRIFVVISIFIVAMIFMGTRTPAARVQFKASVQKDYAMVAPSGVSSIFFWLRYEDDSIATYTFATNDTTRIGVYDTIIDLPTDSIGLYRADWYVTLSDGKLLHFSQYPQIDFSGFSEFDPTADSVMVDVSTADAGLIPAIEDTIYANRDDYKGGAGSVDSALIEQIMWRQVDSLLQKLGVGDGAMIVYEWHHDADSAWYINASGDTVRVTEFLHTGGTAGQRPDTILETRP